jgi:hypothetical protein
MIAIFQANWDGAPGSQPIAYSIGYHLPNFHLTHQSRTSAGLAHVDEHLASRGSGPAVYATRSELARVWPPAPVKGL